MTTMLCAPTNRAGLGDIYACRCRYCKANPGKGRVMHRRQMKRRERQRWKREATQP